MVDQVSTQLRCNFTGLLTDKDGLACVCLRQKKIEHERFGEVIPVYYLTKNRAWQKVKDGCLGWVDWTLRAEMKTGLHGNAGMAPLKGEILGASLNGLGQP